MQTDPTRAGLGVYNGGLDTQVGGTKGGRIATGAGTYDGQLRSTLPDDSAFESFLKRNDGIPKTTLDGIDNTIFMDRKPESERQHDQLMRGDTTEWEDEVFEAHQDED